MNAWKKSEEASGSSQAQEAGKAAFDVYRKAGGFRREALDSENLVIFGQMQSM